MRKKTLIIFLIISISNINFAQTSSDRLYENNPINIKSPQSSDMVRYGNIPVKLSVGELDLNIPLMSLPIKGGESIDINLAYNSSGFLVAKAPSTVGLNWALNVGGVINRKVNVKPDEIQSSQPALRFHGFLTGVRMDPKNKECFYNFSCLNIGGLNFGIGSGTSNRYEGEPDLFSFNFLGFSGEFMIGNDGVPVVKSNKGNLKVNVSKINSIYDSTYPQYGSYPQSTIEITDDNGIKYTFGEGFDAKEYTVNYASSLDVLHATPTSQPVTTSWYLTKVELRNGDLVNFIYEPLDYSSGTSATNIENNSNNKKFLRTLEFNSISGSYSSDVNCTPQFGCLYGYSSTNGISTTIQRQKRAFLKEIRYLNSKILFSYEDRQYKFVSVFATKNGNELALSNIILKNYDSEVNRVDFSYKNLGGTYMRHFLDKVKINNIQEYKFDYNKTDNLPNPLSYGTDHWGFWNGGTSTIAVYPAGISNIDTGEYSIVGQERDPNANFADAGTLRKVTYPTKGYSEFTYEPNYYSKRIERNLQSNFLPGIYNVSGTGGGIRIQSIKNYDENGTIKEEKQYRYTTDLNSTTSSGMMMTWPRYVFAYKQYRSATQVESKTFWESSSIVENTLDNPVISYRKIFEIIPGKGYVEHNFTNFEETPDDNSNLSQYKVVLFNNESEAQFQFRPYELVKNYKSVFLNDKSKFRGLPKLERYYVENSSQPIKTVDYEYSKSFDEASNSKYVAINNESCLFYAQNYKKY